MKTTSLFRLGGIAILLYTILSGIVSLLYFVSGQPSVLGYSVGSFANLFMVLGLGALFLRQLQRDGTLGLVGYGLLLWANVFFVGENAVGLGVSAGVISNEQIAQVPAYALAGSALPWILGAGLIIFGISIYRAQVFPKYAGALLALVGLIQPLTGPLAFTRPIYAVCSFVVWAWLGWILLTNKSLASQELTPAM